MMKRALIAVLLGLLFIFVGQSTVYAADDVLPQLSDVFPSMLIESAATAGQSGEKADVVLSFESKAEAIEPTPTSSPTLPPMLIPLSSLKDKKVEKKAKPEMRVLPIASTHVLGISSFFNRFHHGIDIRAPIGTPVLAMHAGVVTTVAYEAGGYGRYVVIEHVEHGSTVTALYAHLKEATVQEGDQVDAAVKIGSVGMTGRTTGPHLHFEVSQDTGLIDPLRYFTNGVPTKVLAKKI
ncbi:M23 family metallopeptidase [Candidatus Woesebacteria bacterium]|nr:M23 family metallopeptidase [Candidatus Woesebacteria bacterium]